MSKRSGYFAQACSWAEDTRALSARSRRIAWTVAGVACAVALFEAVAIALMLPLKTVQPVTLLVDRQTGFVQALNPLEPRRIGADAALTQSLLAQYVTARESFDRATIRADYRRVALWSAGRARSAYVAAMPASNPASPFQRYSTGTTVAARVKSVSRLQDGVALVRFETQEIDRTGRAERGRPWISVVRYRYSDAAMAFEDRLVNPLGFQVTGYRRDAEAPPLDELSGTANERRSTFGTGPQVASAPTRPPPRPVAYVLERRSAALASHPAVPKPSRALTSVSTSRREVPIGNLPLGSPLGPFPASTAQPADEQQP